MSESLFGIHAAALELRSQRMGLLASNIANAATPHYKARDFNFETAMQHALAGRQNGGNVTMARTQAGHMAGKDGSGLAKLLYRGETQSAVDGNTVDMDVERTQIAENAMQYQILTQLISDEFKGMRSALASTNA